MAAPVSLYGHWPLYLSLYNKAGGCISWVTLTNGTVSGIVDWFAPASKYPAINTGLTLDGGLYTTGPALSNTWNLTFAGAGLTSNLVKTLTLSKLGTVVGTNPVAWSVTVSSGLFTGSFTPPGSKAIPFKGLLLQSDIAGFGFFLTNGLSGGVTVEPAGP